jgi:hypothetical protein
MMIDRNPVRTWVNRIAWAMIIGAVVLSCMLTWEDAQSAETEAIRVEQAEQHYTELKQVASLKQTAEQLLIKLINAATAAGEFIVEEIPLVIKELLRFHTMYYTWLCALGFLFILTAYFITKTMLAWQARLPSRDYDNVDKRDWPRPLVFTAGLILYIPGICIFTAWFPSLLKITLAPRVWLIEYAANLVR